VPAYSACPNSDDSFASTPLKHSARLLGPSVTVRAAAGVRRDKLDRALIASADPAGSRLIAARTAQLGRRSTRARLADGLERLARSADAPRGRSRILPSRAAVSRNRRDLLELAGTLRSDIPLYARGLAMLNVILTDGTGVTYSDHGGDALARQLACARATLAG
jgi:hypothetical protein